MNKTYPTSIEICQVIEHIQKVCDKLVRQFNQYNPSSPFTNIKQIAELYEELTQPLYIELNKPIMSSFTKKEVKDE